MLRKFKVIKEHFGSNDNWNQPKRVELKVGDILEARDFTANERGHLFFSINGDKNNCLMPNSVNSRHPYDKCVFNWEFLEEITEGRDLSHIDDIELKNLLRDEKTVRVTKELVNIIVALKKTKELAISEDILFG